MMEAHLLRQCGATEKMSDLSGLQYLSEVTKHLQSGSPEYFLKKVHITNFSSTAFSFLVANLSLKLFLSESRLLSIFSNAPFCGILSGHFYMACAYLSGMKSRADSILLVAKQLLLLLC